MHIRQRLYTWYVRFFGVEAPEGESDYWRGYRAGQEALWPLLALLIRKIPD